MNFNIFVNGIKISIPEGTTLKDIMNRFFRARCEFIINKNSMPVTEQKYESIILNKNDDLKIIAYSRHRYQPQQTTVFRDDKEKAQ